MKEQKLTNDTFDMNQMTQTEIYKTNIMNNGISKLFNSDRKIYKVNTYYELEKDGSLSDKEILNIYKVENKQLKLKILKVEENCKILQKKCSDYNDLCYLNEKLNKKIEENHKQIISLKSKCEQKDEIIIENEKKIKELISLNAELSKFDIKKNYDLKEKELLELKKLLDRKTINININEIKDNKILVNTFLNEFKKEIEKYIIFDKTKNNLLENIIKKEFNTFSNNLKKIFEENDFSNSKPYKTIEYLNNKMEELYGYKTKAEKLQGQVELLLNEQKLLKEQIKVYKKISDESLKMKVLQKETIDKLRLDINIMKEVIKKTKKYVQQHFSMNVLTNILRILDAR